MLLSDLKKAEPLFREYHVGFAGIFGSYARGEQTEKSDLDLLVRFTKVPGLFTFAHFRRELSRTLGVSVDLLTEQAISPYIREVVLREVKPIYGTR